VQCATKEICTPSSLDELATLVRRANKVRVVGSGHSFSPLVATSDTLVSLDRLSGLVSHDAELLQATVQGGTRLFALGPMLLRIGQALPNMGDIDQQSISGALVTATHGSGRKLGALASQVRAMKIMKADGTIVTISEKDNAEWLQAAPVSLGWLGIVVEVTLQNQAAYRLREKTFVLSLDAFFEQVDALSHKHRHVDAHVFALGKRVLVKVMDETEDAPNAYAPSDFVENTVFGAMCSLTSRVPRASRAVQRGVALAAAMLPSERIGPSFGIFATPRKVKFNEMEYHVPVGDGVACLREVCKQLAKHETPVFFPLEYRYVAGDNLWLSPFGGATRASIAVHQHAAQDPEAIFARTEPILREFGGLPHWGKMHKKADYARLYPEWQAFHKVRAALDPEGKFENEHLRSLREAAS
jgi:FAD-linked oxidoreductase